MMELNLSLFKNPSAMFDLFHQYSIKTISILNLKKKTVLLIFPQIYQIKKKLNQD